MTIIRRNLRRTSVAACSCLVALNLTMCQCQAAPGDDTKSKAVQDYCSTNNVTAQGEGAQVAQKLNLSLAEKDPGPKNIRLINALHSVVAAYASYPEQQLPYYERLLPLEQQLHPSSIRPVSNLAKAYMQAHRYAQAEPYLKQWLAYEDKNSKPERYQFVRIQVLEYLGDAQVHLNKLAEAGRNLDLAKQLYEQQNSKFNSEEYLPQRFLEIYVAYLSKSPTPHSELATYKTRLEKLKSIKLTACPGCGRG
jgi:tetratricopeptide (TPR) repeat protein